MQLKNTTQTSLGLPQGISIAPGETQSDVPARLKDSLFAAAWLKRGMLVEVKPKKQAKADDTDNA